MQLLLIASIGKAQGLRGALHVTPFNAASPLWAPGSELVLVSGDLVKGGQPDAVEAPDDRRLRLATVREGSKGRLVCTFAGVDGRDAAEALGGSYLAVPLEAVAPPDDPDEVLFHEVRGWDVVDTAGKVLGAVVAVVETYTELLEVRPKRGGASFFVPIVKEIVTAFDRAGRRVVIDPPEGLVP
ncbi:MAG: 16S rRNA processing protein RimM [Myxococcales bacterium]|nr:16S rRNA processing protein RimM [Myxococcales bacterium]MCB9733049.1 16S rRNA processing protein RimM [Deltaproteobacteria bacterium]